MNELSCFKLFSTLPNCVQVLGKDREDPGIVQKAVPLNVFVRIPKLVHSEVAKTSCNSSAIRAYNNLIVKFFDLCSNTGSVINLFFVFLGNVAFDFFFLQSFVHPQLEIILNVLTAKKENKAPLWSLNEMEKYIA